MRPSQYHYIKRMWTRNLAKRPSKGCLSTILSGFVLFVLLCCLFDTSRLVPALIAISLTLALCILIVLFTPSKNSNSICENNLEKYKKNFKKLDDIEKALYRSELKIILDEAKMLTCIINSTEKIAEFCDSYNNILKKLRILEQHEYTGWFTKKPPSVQIQEILSRKEQAEISFINRSYKRGTDGKFCYNAQDYSYLELFSEKAKNYLYNSIIEQTPDKFEAPISTLKSKKVMNNYELERFALECNHYLEKNDRKNS